MRNVQWTDRGVTWCSKNSYTRLDKSRGPVRCHRHFRNCRGNDSQVVHGPKKIVE